MYARRARRARVARRPPRAAPSLSTERRPKRRRETRTTTGDGTRVASREGLGRFMFETRRGGGFTICHRRTLRACPKLSSRRHESKAEFRVHPGRAADQFEVSAGYSSRSTRRRYDHNDATGPWNGYMAQESRVTGKKVQIYLELAFTPRRRTARLWGPGTFGARYMGPNPLTDRCG